MNWLLENSFNARPIVAVEDHVYHISDLLRTIQSSDSNIFSSLTVVCLDRDGPDTDAAILEWLKTYPEIQIASRISEPSQLKEQEHRLVELLPAVFENQNEYCRQIAGFIRPQGLLLQDIELESLKFVPPDRWWESTMLATTVRGIVGERPPRCAFISNKRGYEATFGAELLAAGHDPRDVLNKYDLKRIVIPFLEKYLEQNFPQELLWTTNKSVSNGAPNRSRISAGADERRAVESKLDIVLWPQSDAACEIGGRAFATDKKSPVTLSADGNELETWLQLISSKLDGKSGVEVLSVGDRVAPNGALRAESTNAAARHIHSVRKRLANPQDITTVSGHYRLRDGLSVGLARA